MHCFSFNFETYFNQLSFVASDSHFSLTAFSGPQTVWPNTSSKGVKPRESWTDSLAANRTRWTPSPCDTGDKIFSSSISEIDENAQEPLWLGVVGTGHVLFDAQLVHYLLEQTRNKVRSLVRLDKSGDADKTKKNFVRAWIMVFALISLKGITSEKRVEAYISMSRYWFPDFVLGRGPTQSTKTLENGSSKARMGFRWAGGIFWIGFLHTWQVWQELQYWATSCFNLGQ